MSGSVDISILSMMAHADFAVKLVMFILLLASFFTWAVIYEKSRNFKRTQKKMALFEKSFWSGESLQKLYDDTQKHVDHPLAFVFVAAMQEFSKTTSMLRSGHESIIGTHRDRSIDKMRIAGQKALIVLEKHLSFLATIGSSSVYIGLFGTVWGIIHSFQSIAASKNTTLTVVAPGIAEALLATAIGLFAAIPALVAYNKFSNDLADIAFKIEDFSTELGNLLLRQLSKQSSSPTTKPDVNVY